MMHQLKVLMLFPKKKKKPIKRVHAIKKKKKKKKKKILMLFHEFSMSLFVCLVPDMFFF